MIVKGYKIPRVIVGTSPFIAAGQFGQRAFNYYIKFVNNSIAVEKVIKSSIKMGIKGIQVLPYNWVYKAVKSILREHKDVVIVGTLIPNDLKSSIRTLSELRATVSLVHGMISNMRDLEVIEKHLDLCRKVSPLVGLVVHEPYKTLSWLMEVDLNIDVIMAPINKLGYLMDAPPEEVVKLYERIGIPIIGKKV